MKIEVTKPFTYYLDGYKRRDYSIGEHDVPYDCAAFAEQSGFTKREVKGNANNRTRNASGSKTTLPN
ncbi:MAG: hypothetical protein IJU07_00095 [Synergistaceae bacterium]|nr:hypothetical protein [Synergistaceae bacterium]